MMLKITNIKTTHQFGKLSLPVPITIITRTFPGKIRTSLSNIFITLVGALNKDKQICGQTSKSDLN